MTATTGDEEDGLLAILQTSVERLCRQLVTGDESFAAARRGDLPAADWAAVEQSGLLLALVPEDAGGLGLPTGDALALIRILGRHAVPLPIAETMIANAALTAAGLPLADGAAALVPAGPTIGDRVVGVAERVAWGGTAKTFVVQAGDRLARAEAATVVASGSCPAGLPRDTLQFDTPAAIATTGGRSLFALGALVRAMQIAGALEGLLAASIGHVGERVQFGRPLAKFQAVQQSVAQLAGEVAAGSAAADHAAEAFGRDEDDLAIAIARTRLGEAAAKAAAIAHQLHGAIGITREHPLHRLTTAAWSWRDEFGTQRHWQALVGRRALATGRDGFWPMVTAA